MNVQFVSYPVRPGTVAIFHSSKNIKKALETSLVCPFHIEFNEELMWNCVHPHVCVFNLADFSIKSNPINGYKILNAITLYYYCY